MNLPEYRKGALRVIRPGGFAFAFLTCQTCGMAIYHFSAKPIGRSNGRSAIAASAYTSCSRIVDRRTGEVHDYRKKSGLCGGKVVLPGGTTISRDDLWNFVESKHLRGDAVVAREFEIALPHELNTAQNMELTDLFALTLTNIYGVAVDFNIHKKEDTPTEGHWLCQSPHHPHNVHTHLLLSACHVNSFGELGKKCVELDPIHCARSGIPNPMQLLRPVWQDLCNSAMARAGHATRIDHRTLEGQGIERRPGYHFGPCASAIERVGKSSRIREREMARAEAEKAQAAAEAEAEAKAIQKLESLERELKEAQAIEIASRARTRTEVESELTPLLKELSLINAFLLAAPNLSKRAPTAIQLAAARKDAAPAAKRASQARQTSVGLAKELSILGWWRPFRHGTLTRELEDSRRRTSELEDRAARVQGSAKAKGTKEDISLWVKSQTQRKGQLVAKCQTLELELQAIRALEVSRKPPRERGPGVTKPDPQEGRGQTPQRDAGPPARMGGCDAQDIQAQADEAPVQEYERPRGG